jgi:hypothetical protein
VTAIGSEVDLVVVEPLEDPVPSRREAERPELVERERCAVPPGNQQPPA